MNNIEDIARALNGHVYGDGIKQETINAAKECDAVIVMGASDDLVELYGALRCEGDCYEGGTFYLNENGIVSDEDADDDCKTIEAVWNRAEEPHCCWSYKTDIPNVTFNVHDSDGSLYCEGIVFDINSLVPYKAPQVGRWQIGDKDCAYVCSACGESPTKDLDGELYSSFKPAHCPNCGVPMLNS